MKNKGVTIIELLVVAGIFLVMIAVLAPFVHMAKARIHRIDCANNMRKISLGLHAYAADRGGEFPESLGKLYPNYVDDQLAFDCPASDALGSKDKPDYNYRTGLKESSGLREIIVEDIGANHGRAGKNALRVDGSVEWVRDKR